jgi:hypothetical protein
MEVSLLFDHSSIANFDAASVKSELKHHPALQSLFAAAARQLGGINLLAHENSGRTVEFALRLQLETFSLRGEPVVEVDFRGSARLISRRIVSPAVFAYGKPGENPRQPEAVWARNRKSQFKMDGKHISVALDKPG